ncbi:MAG: ABC transporter substrate-binding protein [Pseudomonadota bacterium]
MISRINRSLLLIMVLCIFCAGSPAAAAEEPYKVGVTYAVTGPVAFLGEPARNAALMIQKEINAKGGINGHPLELVVYDNEGDATKAVLTAKKLIQKDNVLAILGASTSGDTMAIIPIATQAKVPLVSQAASRKITSPVDEREWIFNVVPGDDLCVELMYRFMKKRGIKKVALLSVSTGYGISGREALKQLAPKFGMEVVADETYGPKDTDLSSHLTKVRGAGADAIVNWSVGPTQIAVTRNWNQLGIKIPLYQSYGFGSRKNLELAGNAAEGVICPVAKISVAGQLPADDPQAKVVKEFKKMYEDTYKKEPDTFAAHTWDALGQVVSALKAVGPDKAKIRDHLENLKDWPGQNGVFNRTPKDHVGLAWDCYAMVEVKDGDWKLLKE